MAEKEQKKVLEKEEIKEDSNLRFKLVSRLKHPVQIRLKGGENVFISAHGTIDNIDPKTLDTELPDGVHKVEFQV